MHKGVHSNTVIVIYTMMLYKVLYCFQILSCAHLYLTIDFKFDPGCRLLYYKFTCDTSLICIIYYVAI